MNKGGQDHDGKTTEIMLTRDSGSLWTEEPSRDQTRPFEYGWRLCGLICLVMTLAVGQNLSLVHDLASRSPFLIGRYLAQFDSGRRILVLLQLGILDFGDFPREALPLWVDLGKGNLNWENAHIRLTYCQVCGNMFLIKISDWSETVQLTMGDTTPGM